MKLLLSYIIGLFLILSLSACHDGGNATTLLHQADSLMQEFPDSALSLLESISHPEKLSGSERADYAIFLTRARTKLYVHESSDSLIRFAVDYYKRSWNNERKMQAYYYRGCVYRDMRCMDLAVKDFLQALKVIPKESEYLYLGAIYENLAGCYAEQNLYKDAMHAHHKAHEIYIKQKKDDGLFRNEYTRVPSSSAGRNGNGIGVTLPPPSNIIYWYRRPPILIIAIQLKEPISFR